MTTYRSRCLSCGVEMEPSYRYQDCPACRQLQATERLYNSPQSSGAAPSGGDPPGAEVVWIIIGIIGAYWLVPPMWLIMKFFFSLVFGS